MAGRSVIVHIGRAKTGSTAVQAVLAASRAVLAERGFCYPGSDLHHGYLARHLDENLRKVAKENQVAIYQHFSAAYRKELAASTGTVIISSEGFQNVRPAALREWLGDEADVRIVVYIREQVEYLASAYSQRVKSGNVTELFECFAARQNVDYWSFLGAWAAEFGSDRLTVRRYERSRLVNGDAIDDFLAVVGLERSGLSIRKEDMNPSIGGALLEAKLRINALNLPEQAMQDASYEHLLALSRSRPDYRGGIAVPAEVTAAMRDKYAASNEAVSMAYFDGAQLFDLRAVLPHVEISDASIVTAMKDIATGMTDRGMAEQIILAAGGNPPAGRLDRGSGSSSAWSFASSLRRLRGYLSRASTGSRG